MGTLQRGKVAIVTGGRSGIGRGTAEKLAADGFRVYAFGRKAFEDPKIIFVSCDVTDEVQVKQAVESVANREGRIDLLVNCAGAGLLGASECIPVSDAGKQFNVLFFGCVNMVNAVVPVMRKQGGGRIVSVGSMGGAAPLPFQSFYSAAKAGLNAYTDALRGELKPFGITLTTVLPGDTRTGFTEARKIVLTGDDAYGGRIARALEKQTRYEKEGADPKRIGARIAKICEKKHVSCVYTLDVISYLECVLIKFLPHNASNRIIGRMYGEW